MTSRRPPGPDAPVHLGIDPQTLECLTALRDEYGDIVAVTKDSGRHAMLVNDADAVRRLLTRRHSRYRKGPGFERVKMLLGNGLIVSDGDQWRRARTMVQPAFTRQAVNRLTEVMADCADRRAVAWRQAANEGRPVNINTETSDFALELILVCLFGDDYESRVLAGGDNPFAFLSQQSERDLSVVMKARQLRRFMLDIIAARRAETVERPFDFLGVYIDAEDKEGRPFSDDELLDELMTLIIAGFETSANTLAWVWYLLSGHGDVEQRVLEEINATMPDRDAVSADNAAAMLYTQQVLEETLRLYPPVWLFTRRAEESDEIGDFTVAPGTDIYLSPYILHRTAHYWAAPDAFRPERFSLADQPKKERPFFPFSLGPRRCLGEYFSFLEMKVHLARLLPIFRMMPVTNEDPGLELAINLRSGRDIYLQPELRDT